MHEIGEIFQVLYYCPCLGYKDRGDYLLWGSLFRSAASRKVRQRATRGIIPSNSASILIHWAGRWTLPKAPAKL